jgi:hypothetical protein
VSDYGDIRLPRVRPQEVGGVPVFAVDAPPGQPCGVTLLFGVGRMHEDLPMAGITHLVEHLALFRFARQPYAYNGFVDPVRTGFYASGRPDECVAFFESIQHNLVDLPLDRAEVERNVLQVEASSRGGGLLHQLLGIRFGATGPGSLAQEEFGLRWLGPQHAQWWREQNMHARTAVVVAAGVAVEDLKVALPEPPPGWSPTKIKLREVEQNVPAWFAHGGDRNIAVGALAEDAPPTTAALRIATQRLQDRLRRELGVAYAVNADLISLRDGRRHVALLADCAPEHVATVRDEIERQLTDLAERGPTAVEVADDATDIARSWSEPAAPAGLAHALADDVLGGESSSWRSVQRQLTELSPASIQRAAQTIVSTALWALPRGVPGPATAAAIASSSPTKLPGKVHDRVRTTATGNPPKEALVAGNDGLSWHSANGTHSSVRFDDVAVAMWWGNGGRVLLGSDGFRVAVAPWDWYDGAALVKDLDARVAPDRFVHMGAGGPVPGEMRGPLSMSPAIRKALVAVLALILLALTSIAAMPAEPTAADYPDVTPEFIGPDGSVRCSDASAFRIAAGDAEPAPDGAPTAVASACRSEANNSIVIAGGAVAAATALVAVPIVRRRRKKQRHAALMP